MKKFTDEQIRQANSVSILQVANDLGIKVHKVGNSSYSYRSEENSGLVFSEKKNTFFLHSSLFGNASGTGGSVIDFVQMLTDLNFPQTVTKLLAEKYEYVDIDTRPERKEPFQDYFKRSMDKHQSAAKKYLILKRKIDPRIIDHLIKKNYIKEDVYKNIIFYHAKHGVKVGATVQGTVYDPEKFKKRGYFKGIAKNSESGFGFNVQVGSKVTALYIFESPIDALSYWSLHPTLDNAMIASIDGSSTKSKAVYNFINYLSMNNNFENETDLDNFKVYLCMDNDAPDKNGKRAGQEFIKTFLNAPVARQQEPEYKHNRLFVDHSPHKLFKDWNDELQFVRKLEERDQYIAPQRKQVADISWREDHYHIEFSGTDVPEEYANQPVFFDVSNRSEAIKLLEHYDFERISKHDLERFGFDVFNGQAEQEQTYDMSYSAS